MFSKCVFFLNIAKYDEKSVSMNSETKENKLDYRWN